jgi:hypothetical protein
VETATPRAEDDLVGIIKSQERRIVHMQEQLQELKNLIEEALKSPLMLNGRVHPR